jgi:hypothetical protein
MGALVAARWRGKAMSRNSLPCRPLSRETPIHPPSTRTGGAAQHGGLGGSGWSDPLGVR